MYGSEGNNFGEVGPGAPLAPKKAQPSLVTTRTLSPPVVSSGKKQGCEEAAPATSPASKEAAETHTLERPGELPQVSDLDKPCAEVVPISSGSVTQGCN